MFGLENFGIVSGQRCNEILKKKTILFFQMDFGNYFIGLIDWEISCILDMN